MIYKHHQSHGPPILSAQFKTIILYLMKNCSASVCVVQTQPAKSLKLKPWLEVKRSIYLSRLKCNESGAIFAIFFEE
jgi:hypothetical protein